MKIILTEEQYNTLIVENVIKDIFKDLNINTGVLFTFGTGMASLLPVVGRLLEVGEPKYRFVEVVGK